MGEGGASTVRRADTSSFVAFSLPLLVLLRPSLDEVSVLLSLSLSLVLEPLVLFETPLAAARLFEFSCACFRRYDFRSWAFFLASTCDGALKAMSQDL